MPKTSSEPAVFGPGLKIRGRVTGESDLRIEGDVEGDITVTGALDLADGGVVTGRLEAHSVRIAGTLEGELHAAEAVHIALGGRVRGDIHAATFALDEGGIFSGQVHADFELPSELV